MVYLDTNVLIYAALEQDRQKKEISIALIESLTDANALILSPLTLQEYIFTLGRLGISGEIIAHDVTFYQEHLGENYDAQMLVSALQQCVQSRTCKHINDLLHLQIANRYADKLVTFDRDFGKLREYARVEVEVL